MLDKDDLSKSPLSLDDLQKIEDTKLPALERHHLRLLAHCLFSFKSMSKGLNSGTFPVDKTRIEWCLQQPSVVNDHTFLPVLLDQFSAAAKQLEKLALSLSITPLELTLNDLIQASANGSRII